MLYYPAIARSTKPISSFWTDQEFLCCSFLPREFELPAEVGVSLWGWQSSRGKNKGSSGCRSPAWSGPRVSGCDVGCSTRCRYGSNNMDTWRKVKSFLNETNTLKMVKFFNDLIKKSNWNFPQKLHFLDSRVASLHMWDFVTTVTYTSLRT